MTEVTDADKSDGPPIADLAGDGKLAGRLLPVALSAVGIACVVCGVVAYRLLMHGGRPASGEHLVAARTTTSTPKPNSSFDMASKTVQDLEAALRGSGAEVSPPQERGYRAVVPSQRAHALAASIPADAPPYALALRAIAESQFVEARRLLAQTPSADPETSWRAALASSALEVYAGRYDEALRQARAALKLRPDDPIGMNQTGVVLLDAGKFGDAADIIAKAVHLEEKAGLAGVQQLADSLDTLATAEAARGKTADAVAKYQQALALRTKASGGESPANARTLTRLATLYDVNGRFANAEPLYQRALGIVRKHYGAGSAEAAVCLNNLAGHYAEQRQFTLAEPLFKEALDNQVKTLGERNLETAQTLNNLAGVYLERGKTKQAEELFARVLRNQTSAAGSSSPAAAQTMDNLASLYARERRYTDAESLYKRELEIREKSLGKDHNDTAITLNNLACLYTQMGHWRDADALFRQSLAIHDKSGGSANPEAANGCDNYAVLLRKRGRISDARAYEARARKIRAASHP